MSAKKLYTHALHTEQFGTREDGRQYRDIQVREVRLGNIINSAMVDAVDNYLTVKEQL